MPRRIIGYSKRDGAPVYSIFPLESRPPGVKQRFYCGEEGCEQEWTGVEADLRGAMAIHLMTVHHHHPLKTRVKITPPPELKEEDVEPDDSKLDRDDVRVNYRYATDPAKSCGQCRFFSLPGSCARVKGPIRSVDSCNLWEQAAHPQVDPEGHPTGAGGGKESIRAFESSYGEAGATLPKSKNKADTNFSINEALKRVRQAGWQLGERQDGSYVWKHRSLPGHTLEIKGSRFFHHDREGALVAHPQRLSKLADYAEGAPKLLRTVESVAEFNRHYS